MSLIKDYIEETLEEMIKELGISVNDYSLNIISYYADNIAEGIEEGYFLSANFVADCNLKEEKEDEKDQKINELKKELDTLYRAINAKGHNFSYRNGNVYDSGMRYVGGTISASYEDKII